MKLYKFYRDAKYNVDAVDTSRIWLAHPSTFNDPLDARFDFTSRSHSTLIDIAAKDLYPSSMSDYARRRAMFKLSITGGEDPNSSNISVSDTLLKYFEKTGFSLSRLQVLENALLDKKIQSFVTHYRSVGIASFTEISNLNNPAHWAYYGDYSKGFCVEWTVDLSQFQKMSKDHFVLKENRNVRLMRVKYSNSRKLLQRFSNAALFNQYRLKTKRWMHESEWRVIVSDKTQCLATLPMKPSKLYFGYVMSDKRKVRLYKKFNKIDQYMMTVNVSTNGFSAKVNLVQYFKRLKKKKKSL